MDSDLSGVERCVTDEMNASLMQDFHPLEVCEALFQMHPSKSPGPDGMSALFFQKGSPTISYLFFADDSLLFGKATKVEGRAIRDILSQYEVVSSQKVNLDKSSIFFSQNTAPNQQAILRDILSISQEGNHGKYLGLPTLIGKSKKEVFSILKERVWKKLQGWKEKLLSQAGKEVLIKAVAQAIPTYAMSCFKLPLALCEEMKAMISNFWWGQKASERKIHWLKWDLLCFSKKDGGLGFRDFSTFNNALLAKQVWRLFTNEDSLIFRLLKARYFPYCNLLSSCLGTNPSFS
ncbi:hypothetical protein L1049_020462 [Liquidambar formosana]|uniref:Reverse transcriptase n=1 Tax=Liquidambar formosana TaxID=63359 RepID=A0AAP0SE04_LIQFO